MERLGDALKKLYRQVRVSDEPVSTCQFCGKPLYMMQLEVNSNGKWIPVGPPYVEECDCEEAKKVRAEEERKRQLKAVAEQKKAKIEFLLKRSGLGKRFRERTFATWDESVNTQAYKAVLNYATHWWDMWRQGKGLYIFGPYGTGKTHLAGAVANFVIQNYEVPVLFGTLTRLLQPVKDAIGDAYRLEKERVLLYGIDLLVIDDLGKERPTDFVIEELYNIINSRYENMKPVVITTNYSLSELEQKYNRWSKDYGEKDIGSALASRLREMCYFIKLEGEDYRERRR